MSLKAYKSGSAFPEIQKDKIRVYSSRLCPYAERARLVLHHKNIIHEIVNIDLKDKPDWFTSRTPTGTVPVIEHNGAALFESTAVSEYLDDTFPGDKLQPTDPCRKAQDRILLEMFGKFTTPYYGVLFNSGNEEKKAEVEEKIILLKKSLQFYETELAKRGSEFFGGKAPAMIDFFIWPWFERLPVMTLTVPSVDISQYPKLANWWKVMTQVPAVKEVMCDTDWHLQVMKMYRAGNQDAPNLGLEE